MSLLIALGLAGALLQAGAAPSSASVSGRVVEESSGRPSRASASRQYQPDLFLPVRVSTTSREPSESRRASHADFGHFGASSSPRTTTRLPICFPGTSDGAAAQGRRTADAPQREAVGSAGRAADPSVGPSAMAS